MAGRRLASVSIDLDPLACYYRIHALGSPPRDAALAGVVLAKTVPRWLDVLGRAGVTATFFVVGSDLDGEAGRSGVRQLAAAGHELASHSDAHAYDMARWPIERVRADLAAAHRKIGDLAGAAPVGFRAPGYDLSPAMLEVIAGLGYHYDSSLFPAPGYYAAKAAVMAGLALVGRPSGAVLTNPRALLAPADPYRPDMHAPWRRGQAPVVELPIAVTPKLRVPAIGTNLLLAPSWLRARWLRDMAKRRFFNFELHGIDLIDAEQDGIPRELVARQPDLRRPLAAKRRALEDILAELVLHADVPPLTEVAKRVQREGRL
jgi:hypothetical protein